MVYITRANFKKIVIQKIDIKSINIREEIYKITMRWFNQYEVKELLAFKKMYQNPEEFFEIYKKINPSLIIMLGARFSYRIILDKLIKKKKKFNLFLNQDQYFKKKKIRFTY